jgi:hypothetical protein
VKSWGSNLNERELAEAAADLDLDSAFGLVLKKLEELGIATNRRRHSRSQNPPSATLCPVPENHNRRKSADHNWAKLLVFARQLIIIQLSR